MTENAHPPETLEGWYALHQVLRAAPGDAGSYRDAARALAAEVAPLGGETEPGWSAVAELLTGPRDLLVIHFRASFDDIGKVRAKMRESNAFEGFEEIFSMVSVTEAGLYQVSADLALAAAARGGVVGDEVHRAELENKRAAELASEHVQRRLFPRMPEEMPFVCFYPMSKRRQAGQNWYMLTLAQRSQLMRTHGGTGRRYAGRIQQVITGGIGFSEWEWGVTLFAKDPLDFKKLVTDMRFDEVSAKYAEFGPFFVGRLAPG